MKKIMENMCLKCKKEAKVLCPGDLCSACYSKRVPDSKELEGAWKDFMEGVSANRMIGGEGRDLEVVNK